MDISSILIQIVSDHTLHAKWLNTLSFMENAGARKISAAEHKEQVTLLILKHAAEEHRHAYYLKKQLFKLENHDCPTYSNTSLIAPKHTRFYLNTLDVLVCRYLKQHFNLSGDELKFAAYLYVTYAIEVRADELYPIYQEILTLKGSRVTVKSIILEEEGHLEEMLNQLREFSPDWEQHAVEIVKIEQQMFDNWMIGLQAEVGELDSTLA
jgi:bacterioferritin (cytochrome b1)